MSQSLPSQTDAILALEASGQTSAALERLDECLQTPPEDARTCFLAGCLYERLNEHERARNFYIQSLQRDPEATRVWHRLGIICLFLDNLEEAAHALQMAVQQAPTELCYHVDLSMVYSRQGKFEDALNAAGLGHALSPDYVPALNNVAHALQSLGRSAESLPYYERAIELDPENAACRFGYAVSLLHLGRFDLGWKEYEWRWRACQTPRTDLKMPYWQGQDLQGKTILVHHEQGYGDTLQFIRFVPLLKARGATVLVQVPVPLVRILKTVKGIDEVGAIFSASRVIDYHCPLLGLPLQLQATPRTGALCPYLSSSSDEQDKQGSFLRNRLQGDPDYPDLIVGLVWSGDPRPNQQFATQTDRRRSIALEKLAPLFEIDGVRFVSFQMGTARYQIAETGLNITDGTDGITDFADTAARLYGVDLLISVDTAMVHLAGALNRPVWMLSRHDACWRWQERGETTPWYPSMRIFRQPRSGDWDSPVSEITSRLKQFVSLYRSHVEAQAA